MKNKQIGIIAGVVILLLVIAGAFLGLNKSTQPQQPIQEQMGIEEEVVPTLAPEEIGLDFFSTKNKTYVKFIVTKGADIQHIDYNIIYDAQVEGNVVSQGLNGEVEQSDFTNGKVEAERILGTCSTGGKCRFDQGVSSVQIIMKITK